MANTTFTPVTCQRARVAAQLIATSAKIKQGGVGKVPSSLYQDAVMITVTPLDGSASKACS